MHSRKLRLRKISLGLIIAISSGTSQAITPNDPFFPVTSPGVNGLPINYQWAIHNLNLEPAWDLATGHAYLGMLESGIDINHPDLVGNFRPRFSYDFTSNDTNVDELDGETFIGVGHGTHVAGIMAAVTNNNTGTVGVCWYCSLMVTKMRRHDADSGAFHVNRQANSINWLVENGVQGINISYGGAISSFLVDDSYTCDTLPSSFWGSTNENEAAAANYCDALAYAEEFDVVIAAASGNGVRTAINEIHYPASDPRVIAVGAVDIQGNASPDVRSVAIHHQVSFPGINIEFNFAPEKDLVAPGFNILSTFFENQTWNDNVESGNYNFHVECADYIDENTAETPIIPRPTTGGDGYGPCSGTSMAAPHVTGIVGILRSINP